MNFTILKQFFAGFLRTRHASLERAVSTARAEAATEYVGGMRPLALPSTLTGRWRELVPDCLDAGRHIAPVRRIDAVGILLQ